MEKLIENFKNAETSLRNGINDFIVDKVGRNNSFSLYPNYQDIIVQDDWDGYEHWSLVLDSIVVDENDITFISTTQYGDEAEHSIDNIPTNKLIEMYNKLKDIL